MLTRFSDAVLHPLDRLADHQRGDDRADVAGVDRHLVAEAAADVGRDDPDLVLGQAGDQRVDGAVGVRRLAGRPEGQLAADPLVVGDAAAGLHRRRVDARVDDVLGHHDVGLGEDGLGRVLVAGLPVEAVVVGLALEVGADHRGVGRERRADVDDRRQDVVLDVDQLERVACGVAVLGDDERDLLALEAHPVGGEHGLDVVGQGRHPGQALLGQVGAGDDGLDLGVRLGGADVDADDVRVRDRRPQDREVQHALAAGCRRQYLPMPRMKRGSSLRSIRPWPTGCWSLSACSRSSVLRRLGSSTVVMTRSPRSRRRRLLGGLLCAAAHCTDRTIVV